MNIKEWGEEKWIQFLKEEFPFNHALTGIGDDCAVIPYDKEHAWLVTTDALVEGVHFLKEEIPPFELGYKTLAVNVSDIAAMGGSPLYAFLTIAFSPDTDSQWMRHFVEGLKSGCNKWNIQLLGGDTVGSKRDLFINLTVIGSAGLNKIKYRHQAKPGDIICVTGNIGNAGGGLQALQENAVKTKSIQTLIHSHFHPEPYLQQGIWLASQQDVHAMMDLSDGLDCDLTRLIKSSQCGAVIESTNIPISESLFQACKENHWEVFKYALTGGEDYCLLLTISPKTFSTIQEAYKKEFSSSLYPIGKITDQPHVLLYQKEGKPVQFNYKNYEHFIPIEIIKVLF